MDFNYDTKQKKTKRNATVWTLLGLVAGAGVLYSLGAFSGITSIGGDATASPFTHKAVAVVSGDSKVSGTVTFTQTALGHPVTVSGKLKGLDANSKRGFHIHAFGDLTNGCQSPGSHFNPFNQDHGAPEDKARHVGDLGNIESDSEGVAEFSFEDKLISLNGPLSIIGRAVMVHTDTDDLGRGDNDDSKKTGNAGGRAACGVIGFSSSD